MFKHEHPWLYWSPRVLSLLFALFLMVFSLDVFDSASSFADVAIGLFMHNIPAFILLAVAIIAWKRPLVGTVVFSIAGLLYLVLLSVNLIMHPNPLMPWFLVITWGLPIAGPAFLVALLFYFNWRKEKEDMHKELAKAKPESTITLAQLGILRKGKISATYRNAIERPIELQHEGIFDAKKDLTRRKAKQKRRAPPKRAVKAKAKQRR